MKKLRITGESLPIVKEIDCGGNEELEKFCIFCGEKFPSRFGRCPYCKQFAPLLGYWVFNEDWRTIHLGFVRDCGARWEKNYKIEPLPVDMDVNRF